MKELTEKQIENAILEYLSYLPGTYWKTNNIGVYDVARKVHRKPGKYFRRGVADIIGIDGTGKLVAIEVKTKKGRVSPSQKEFLEDINKYGGIGFVARSVDDVRRELYGQ